MAATDGSAPEHLTYLRDAADEVKRHGIYHLLRGAEARAPSLPRIGESRLPAQNVVDLAQVPALKFPASTLEAILMERGRARVEGYWFGLTGPMGPLPLHLTEFAHYERRYSKKHPFGRFLDVIAGRMLQFFYRVWADANPAANADRPTDDRFSGYLASLSGAMEGVKADAAFPARARLHYAALYASRRSPAGIQDALRHLLGVSVRVEEYIPVWRDIEPEDQSRLGMAYNRLGQDAAVGARASSVADAFRVSIRVDTFREYETFLPGGRRYDIAAEALDSFAPSHLEWDIQLEMPEAATRPAGLDGRARLGWTSWMTPKDSGRFRTDARLGRSARRVARAEGKKRQAA